MKVFIKLKKTFYVLYLKFSSIYTTINISVIMNVKYNNLEKFIASTKLLDTLFGVLS